MKEGTKTTGYQGEERRAFTRFPIELLVEISAEYGESYTYYEETNLQEISGGGAKFITDEVDRYFPGQVLNVTIYLPGSDRVRAHMKGKATVVRIDQLSGSEANADSEMVGVAIRFSSRLNFSRD